MFSSVGRLLLITSAVALAPWAAHAELFVAGPTALPTSVVRRPNVLEVVMNNGDRLRFERSKGVDTFLRMTMGTRSYVLDLRDCKPFGPIAPETIELTRAAEGAESGDFMVRFMAGAEQDRRFGELPNVQVSYSGGRPSQLLVTHRESATISRSTRLCNWLTPPEREHADAIAAFRDTMAEAATLNTDELVRRFVAEPVFWRQLDIGKFLAARRDPTIVRRLEPLLVAEDRHVRVNAAYVVAAQGDPRGLRIALTMLDDRTERACGQGIVMGPCTSGRQIVVDRYAAVHALGLMRDPRAVPALARLIGDPEVGYHVPWALSEIGTPEVVAPIMRALDDSDPTVRVLAIESLQRLKAREALPKLRALQNDAQRSRVDKLRSVGEAAREAIVAIERVQIQRATSQ